MSADSRKPAIITAPTIAHLKMNRIFFVHPLYNGFFARCFPSAPRRQYCQLRGFRFASGSFCCRSVPLFLCSAPHRYNHSIASCQKNASGIRARAYNVIYIIARFYCVVYTKKALYLPFIFVQVSQTLKPAKTFSKRIIVQILYTIVPITKFYLCSRCTIFRLRKKDCLYKITYLLSNSQRQCVSTAYNTLPGVSQLFEP